jgi:hypothetical protein
MTLIGRGTVWTEMGSWGMRPGPPTLPACQSLRVELCRGNCVMHRRALRLRASWIGQGFSLGSDPLTAEDLACCGCPLACLCGVLPVRLCSCSCSLLLLPAHESVKNSFTLSSWSAGRTKADLLSALNPTAPAASKPGAQAMQLQACLLSHTSRPKRARKGSHQAPAEN